MIFTTIEEIKEYFKLHSVEDDHLKKEIKKLMQKHHPDPTNNGEFESPEQKEKYLRLSEALNFLSQKNTSLLLRDDLKALTKKVNDLALTQNKNIGRENIKQEEKQLSQVLNESIQTFHNRNRFPKISSLIFAAVVSAIWAFPNTVKDNPSLSFLYENHQTFTVVWIFILVISIIFWFTLKTIEARDEEIKKSYKIEAIQNQMFILFTNWLVAHRRFDYSKNREREDKTVLRFSKDDLSSFLINDYPHLKNYKRLQGLPNYEIVDEIRTFSAEKRKLNSNLFNDAVYKMINGNFLPKAGEIDIETSQLIVELIVQRLLAKNIIELSTEKSLSDIYKYEFNY